MRAAALDTQGFVRNFIEDAPRDVPAGAVLIPEGTAVTIGWRYWRGAWSAPAVTLPPAPPPPRDIEAEFSQRVDQTTTLAGLRAVVRDYLAERSAAG